MLQEWAGLCGREIPLRAFAADDSSPPLSQSSASRSGIHGQRCRSRPTEPCLLTVREACECRGEARDIANSTSIIHQ